MTAARMLADWLTDFGHRPSADVLPRLDVRHDAAAPAPREEPKLDELLARAREDGRRDAFAEAAEHHASAIAREREAFQIELTKERTTWATREGEAMAAQIVVGLDAIAARLDDAVARALTPVIAQAVRDKALASLADDIAHALADDSAAILVVRGPADLVDALQRRLGTRAAAVTIEIADGVDVQVTMGDTVIETRLAAWRDALIAADG